MLTVWGLVFCVSWGTVHVNLFYVFSFFRISFITGKDEGSRVKYNLWLNDVVGHSLLNHVKLWPGISRILLLLLIQIKTWCHMTYMKYLGWGCSLIPLLVSFVLPLNDNDPCRPDLRWLVQRNFGTVFWSTVKISDRSFWHKNISANDLNRVVSKLESVCRTT